MKAVMAPVHFLVAQSLGASFNSTAENVLQADVVSIQLNYSGSTPTGTIAIQGSLDGVNYAAIPVQVGTTVVTSIALPASTSPIIASLANLNVLYIRVAFTYVSGSGTMDGYISYKRIGD